MLWQHSKVSRREREQRNAHRSFVLWFTGLSGAGKTTIAHALERYLADQGCRVYVLDGDNLRHGLCGDLGFSAEDRSENLRRVREVAKLMVDAGMICLSAFISPDADDREAARRIFAANEFFEIYCDADLQVCEQRDVKGLYRLARAGELENFTGISSPYDVPASPDLRIASGEQDIQASVEVVVAFLEEKNLLNMGYHGSFIFEA